MRPFVIALMLCAGGCATVPGASRTPGDLRTKGVALGFVVPGAQLERALSEVHRLGADEVSILVPLYTEGIDGTTVQRGALDDARGGDGDLHPAPLQTNVDETQRSDAQLAEVITRARAHGLSVLVFPIVRLRVRRAGEWRGKLAPPDRDGWWDAYTAQLRAIATVAARAGATRLAIGSELVSFEGDVQRWCALAASLRRIFPGRLCYSANWDRYRDVQFWSAVDDIGISAYFSLAERGTSPSIAALTKAWRPIVDELRAFATRIGRPVLFTEVGFPSVKGAAYWPWNDHQLKTACNAGEGCEGALDLEGQRRLWSAFVRVFGAGQTPFLRGTYVWLWAGRGGLCDRGYTPHGKPAEAVLKSWYGGTRSLPIP
ncbi:MAG: hypothetical protein ABI321_04235 [Polyangia bacterium]